MIRFMTKDKFSLPHIPANTRFVFRTKPYMYSAVTSETEQETLVYSDPEFEYRHEQRIAFIVEDEKEQCYYLDIDRDCFLNTISALRKISEDVDRIVKTLYFSTDIYGNIIATTSEKPHMKAYIPDEKSCKILDKYTREELMTFDGPVKQEPESGFVW